MNGTKHISALILLIACFAFCFGASQAAVTVTGSDAAGLVNEILGSGITVSNISYSGALAASGKFSGGAASGIVIDKGVILTSGYATNAQGLNNSDNITGIWGSGGDSDLNGLVPGYPTYDAAVLEFDFESAGGDLYFNYVFASEEYNEYTNTPYNDVFGFFLDGVNIALIPGTSTPVSINNVNGGNPYGWGASNPQYYNNNDLNDGGPYYSLQYDGFTDVFTAQFLNLAAGTHHIKLAIADAGDTILDSAVFIQAGTFSDNPTPPEPTVPAPGAAGLVLLGMGLTGWLRRRIA